MNPGKVLYRYEKHNLVWRSFLSVLGIACYISLVSFIIFNGEKIFGKMHNLLGPVSFLLLFVMSASITGGLVLAKPIMLYIDNRKQEAVRLFLYTIGWIFAATLSALAVQILIV